MPPTTAHDSKHGLLVIVSGPSGAGKTTLARALHDVFAGSLLSVSLTTRPRAERERDGVDYHFVDEAEFLARVDRGEFLEHAGVYGKRYGTLRAPVDDAMRDGRLVILEIDVQGAKQVKAQLPDAMGLFVLPPSEDALLERLRARRRDTEEVIQKRFARARDEMTEARRCGVYDLFLVNDDLDRAVADAVQAVRARLP